MPLQLLSHAGPITVRTGLQHLGDLVEILVVFLQLCFCSSLQLRKVKRAKLSCYGEKELSFGAPDFSTGLQRRAVPYGIKAGRYGDKCPFGANVLIVFPPTLAQSVKRSSLVSAQGKVCVAALTGHR